MAEGNTDFAVMNPENALEASLQTIIDQKTCVRGDVARTEQRTSTATADPV